MARKHALVLEDDTSLRTVLDRVIRSVAPDINITWVDNAEEALSRVESGFSSYKSGDKYDLIVADIFLEGTITGVDFWQMCQTLCPDTSILLMSSMSPDHFLKTIGRNSVSPPFLSKPFQVGECKQIVTELLRYSDLPHGKGPPKSAA